MKLKRIGIIFVIFLMPLSSGCWDKIEVEQRAFIGAMLIDKAEKEGEGEFISPEHGKDNLKVYFGIINPSKVQGGEEAFITETVYGINFPESIKNLSSRIPRVPFFGHVRVLVITEAIVKDSKTFREILDEIERAAVINHQMKVVILKNSSEVLTKVKPKLENLNSTYITGIINNSKISGEIVSISYSELLQQVRNNNGRAAVPVIKVESENNKGYVIDELALIDNYKFTSYLDPMYVNSYKLITKKFVYGRRFANLDGIIVPYYVGSSKLKISLVDEKKLKYRVKLEMEGDIEQFRFGEDIFKPETIKKVKRELEKTIKKELEETTQYFQNEVGYDFLGFRDYTYKYHNKTYKKYKKDWDSAFKKADIEYDVKVNIRRVGTSKK